MRSKHACHMVNSSIFQWQGRLRLISPKTTGFQHLWCKNVTVSLHINLNYTMPMAVDLAGSKCPTQQFRKHLVPIIRDLMACLGPSELKRHAQSFRLYQQSKPTKTPQKYIFFSLSSHQVLCLLKRVLHPFSIALLQHCRTHGGLLRIKIDAAESEISSFSFHVFFLVKPNSTADSWVGNSGLSGCNLSDSLWSHNRLYTTFFHICCRTCQDL